MFCHLLVLSLVAIFCHLINGEAYDWLRGNPVPSSEEEQAGLLPTTNYTNLDYPIFLNQNASFVCEGCQALVYVIRHEVFKKLKSVSGGGFGKYDFELETLLTNQDICHVYHWDFVSAKTDIYSRHDFEELCRDMLEKDEEAVVHALEMEKGKAQFSTVTKKLCIDLFDGCNEEDIWSDEDTLERREDSAQRYRRLSEEFLAKNKLREGVRVTDSGLHYEVLKEPPADAERIAPRNLTAVANVVYNVTFINGISFDSSGQWGESVDFYMDNALPGLTEGLTLTGVGGDIILYLPAGLAFGEKGLKQTVGGNMVLVYRIQMTGVREMLEHEVREARALDDGDSSDDPTSDDFSSEPDDFDPAATDEEASREAAHREAEEADEAEDKGKSSEKVNDEF